MLSTPMTSRSQMPMASSWKPSTGFSSPGREHERADDHNRGEGFGMILEDARTMA